MLIAITAYLTYRNERGKLKIDRYVGLSEKANLTIQPIMQEHCKEIVMIANAGIAPIDGIGVKIDITIRKGMPWSVLDNTRAKASSRVK